MPYEEASRWHQGELTASFYEEGLREVEADKQRKEGLKKVVKPQEMPWEQSRQGYIKHLVNAKMPVRIETVDAYMQEIPPGGRSGKHRHMAEEYVYILEGTGYDLHWDVEVDIKDTYVWTPKKEPSRWEWEAGDSVYIPTNTVHQHFNADPQHPARFIS